MYDLKPPLHFVRGHAFTRDVAVRMDRNMRTSGLLARLSPQDLQTLICLSTYADRSGRCALSGRDVARALDLSEKQGTERLRRLPQLRFHGKPLVVIEGERRTGSGRFARSKFRILPLPGLEVRECKRCSGKWDGERASSEEGLFPLPPGKAVKFPSSSNRSGKLTSGSRAVTARGNGVVNNYNNKTTQQTGEDKEEVQEGKKEFKLLRSQGVSELTALDIVRNYPTERIERQVDMLPFRDARDPAAMLVKAIREDWAAPSAYAAALREKAAKREEEKAESEVEARRKAHQRRVEEATSKLSPQEMRDITARAREKVKTMLKGALGDRIPQRLVDAQVRKIISEEYLHKPDE